MIALTKASYGAYGLREAIAYCGIDFKIQIGSWKLEVEEDTSRLVCKVSL